MFLRTQALLAVLLTLLLTMLLTMLLTILSLVWVVGPFGPWGRPRGAMPLNGQADPIDYGSKAQE